MQHTWSEMWVDAVLLALWLKQSCLTSDFCSFPLVHTRVPTREDIFS